MDKFLRYARPFFARGVHASREQSDGHVTFCGDCDDVHVCATYVFWSLNGAFDMYLCDVHGRSDGYVEPYVHPFKPSSTGIFHRLSLAKTDLVDLLPHGACQES